MYRDAAYFRTIFVPAFHWKKSLGINNLEVLSVQILVLVNLINHPLAQFLDA